MIWSGGYQARSPAPEIWASASSYAWKSVYRFGGCQFICGVMYAQPQALELFPDEEKVTHNLVINCGDLLMTNGLCHLVNLLAHFFHDAIYRYIWKRHLFEKHARE